MFCRGELILSGTTTTGTGTLTLAATAVPPGGVDPVAAFGTSGAFPVSYVIREYTDTTFSTLKQFERGYGTLTLSTLTSTTLSRTPTVTATSLNSQPATYNNSSATAITIGTAANVLVEIGPNSAEDALQGLPAGFYSTSGITSADGVGITPAQSVPTNTTGFGATAGNTQGIAYYQKVLLLSSGLIKSVSCRVTTAVTTPTTNSLAMALFEVGSNGLPGKRLINFGTSSGTTGAPLGATGTVTITAGAAVYIPAGVYILGWISNWSGGSGSVAYRNAASIGPSPFGTNFNTIAGTLNVITSATGNLNDPPTVTSPAVPTLSSGQEMAVAFRST